MPAQLSGLKPWIEQEPEDPDTTDDSVGAVDEGNEYADPDDVNGPEDEDIEDAGDQDGEELADDADDSGEAAADGETDAEAEGESEFPEYLLNAAGITAEQAAQQFGTPEALEDQLAQLDARFMQAGQWRQPMPPPMPPQWQQPWPPQQPQQQQQLPPPSDGQDWDDDTKQLINALTAQQQIELQKRDAFMLQQQQLLGALVAQQQQAGQQQYVDSFDEFINGLGNEWKNVLGEGSGWEMPFGSIQVQNRIHLDQVANQMAAGRTNMGQPELPRRELLARALRVAFPRQQEAAVRRQVAQQLTGRQRQMTQRPTHRRTKGVKGEEKAMARADKFYREAGLPPENDDFDYGAY